MLNQILTHLFIGEGLLDMGSHLPTRLALKSSRALRKFLKQEALPFQKKPSKKALAEERKRQKSLDDAVTAMTSIHTELMRRMDIHNSKKSKKSKVPRGLEKEHK